MEWTTQPWAAESVYSEIYPTFDQVKHEYEVSLLSSPTIERAESLKCQVHANEVLRRFARGGVLFDLVCPLCEIQKKKNKSVASFG